MYVHGFMHVYSMYVSLFICTCTCTCIIIYVTVCIVYGCMNVNVHITACMYVPIFYFCVGS